MIIRNKNRGAIVYIKRKKKKERNQKNQRTWKKQIESRKKKMKCFTMKKEKEKKRKKKKKRIRKKLLITNQSQNPIHLSTERRILAASREKIWGQVYQGGRFLRRSPVPSSSAAGCTAMGTGRTFCRTSPPPCCAGTTSFL